MFERAFKPQPQSLWIAGLLRPQYSPSELVDLRLELDAATRIPLNPLGRVCASTRTGEGEDPTHYDAVWVRDSLWAVLGLELGSMEQADRVLRDLIAYFGSDAQLARLRAVIRDPSIADQVDGCMEVLHIRFDGKSPQWADVQEGAQPQRWNHKQHDAVGLFAQAVAQSLAAGRLGTDSLSSGEWELLLRLPTYWASLDYSKCEDAGSWEEIERTNSSSIGLVLSGLEAWQALMQDAQWGNFLLQKARSLGLDTQAEALFTSALQEQIDCGYSVLFSQLPHESPAYAENSPKFRRADAALLNLIYPCQLSRWTMSHSRQVLEAVGTLVRELGILRYERDAYQSGNYWLDNGASTLAEASEADSRTGDHSTEQAFEQRHQRFIPGTEAQWFFDSWVSVCYGRLYNESMDPSDYALQTHFFNRALCQITGEGMVGADGKPVPGFSLPESYNTLVENGSRRLVPSPITPLNWSKACLRLALDKLVETTAQSERLASK